MGNNKLPIPARALSETLSKKTNDELRELARAYKIKRVSGMKKAGLIAAVSSALMDPRRLEEILYVINPTSWALFQRVATHGVIDISSVPESGLFPLQQLGYLQSYLHEGRLYCLMPTEIQGIYEQLRHDGIGRKKAKSDLLHAYAMAAINLYGLISQDEFVDLFSFYTGVKVTVDEAFAYLIRHIMVGAGYCFWDNYIVCDSFEEDGFDGAKDLLLNIQGKPRFTPPKEEFLKYSNEDYFEWTRQVDILEKHLRESFFLPASDALVLTNELCFLCRDDAPLEELLRCLPKYGIALSQTVIEQAASVLVAVKNNTRLWVNRGYTPTELSSLFQSKTARNLQKVGRNDPCPCGSGKKYKKCCGRDR